MRHWLLVTPIVFCVLIAPTLAEIIRTDSDSPCAQEEGSSRDLKAVIARYLGRPYVWGSSGLKSFDCSGFVWRVIFDSGILIKRTSARKLCMCLSAPSESEQWDQGTIVFFDNLKHCGIVNDRSSFYHAACQEGTTCSPFDPYWRDRISGFRSFPQRY